MCFKTKQSEIFLVLFVLKCFTDSFIVYVLVTAFHSGRAVQYLQKNQNTQKQTKHLKVKIKFLTVFFKSDVFFRGISKIVHAVCASSDPDS